MKQLTDDSCFKLSLLDIDQNLAKFVFNHVAYSSKLIHPLITAYYHQLTRTYNQLTIVPLNFGLVVDTDANGAAYDAEDDVVFLDAQELDVGFEDLVRMNEADVAQEEVVLTKSWKTRVLS